MKKSKATHIINSVWVVAIVGFLFVSGIRNRELFINATGNIFERGSDSASEEKAIAQNLTNRMEYVHINGLGARVAQQKILNDVIRDDNGQMYRVSDMNDGIDKETQKKAAQNVDAIFRLSQELGAEFLYAQRPIKHPLNALAYGYKDHSRELEQFRVKYCREQGQAVLDLRDALKDRLEFYNTDHHWTIESAYHAAKIMEEALGHSTEVYDESKFSKLAYKDCFLGSMGIRTGKYFGGIDDIEYLIPVYDTDFHYEHLVGHKLKLKKDGDFQSAFLDKDKLNGHEYFNKYEATLNGSCVETRIINNKVQNDKKILVIGDSFGRASVMYTALNYRETRYLDPQVGRYNDNYLDYIREYQPDVIVVMTHVEINVG